MAHISLVEMAILFLFWLAYVGSVSVSLSLSSLPPLMCHIALEALKLAMLPRMTFSLLLQTYTGVPRFM